MPFCRTVTSGLSCSAAAHPTRANHELPRRVRAIIAAITDADAAIVNLRIQPLRRVIGRVHGADRLTRRVIAVLTEHRHEPSSDVGILSFPIALDSDPIDRPSLRRFLFSGNANVVLRMASHDTGFATCTAIEIDDHFPLVGLVLLARSLYYCSLHVGTSDEDCELKRHRTLPSRSPRGEAEGARAQT